MDLKVNVTKILMFDEKSWMKTFIEFNINKRKVAMSDYEINFFKLMNNLDYGKHLKRSNITILILRIMP